MKKKKIFTEKFGGDEDFPNLDKFSGNRDFSHSGKFDGDCDFSNSEKFSENCDFSHLDPVESEIFQIQWNQCPASLLKGIMRAFRQ